MKSKSSRHYKIRETTHNLCFVFNTLPSYFGEDLRNAYEYSQ